MTVSATARRAGPFAGNGATTSFPFTFKVFDEADLRVVENTDGVESDAVLNSDYTVTLNADQDASPGGSIVYAVAPAADTTITLISEMEYTQPTDLPDGGAYRAQNVEDAIDRLAMLVQQLRDISERGLRLADTDDDAVLTLPALASRANTVLGFDADGRPIAAAGGVVAASAFMATVLDDETADLALATLLGDADTAAVLTLLGVSAYVQTLLNDANAAAARATLGSGATGDALFLTASALAARQALGFSGGVVIDRAYAEYTTNATLTTSIPADDTVPQNTEGTQIISLAFTPKSATSRLRLRFQGQITADAAAAVGAAIFSSASASAIKAGYINIPGNSNVHQLALEYEYVPGVTSSLTFTVRAGPVGVANVRLNGHTTGRLLGGAMGATLVIEEIAP